MVEFIKRKEDIKVKLFFTTPLDLKMIIGQYRKDIEQEVKKVGIQEGKEINVIKIVQGLIENAIKEGASDVHIEPSEDKSLVRYRVDGILREVIFLPKELHAGVLSRLKILAHLKIDEHRLPQDGRISMSGPDYRVSIRVSIVPVLEGEKVVLRILQQEIKQLSLEDLGLLPKFAKIVREEIKRAQGMILAVGPTGCGKTTTLYTLLGMINRPGINISTIEDPIEYSMRGVNQSQVNPQIGYTFAAGLRAFLRQDPNVIMVGEIRDQETAEIAMHAALTGHLVLSTLHTNDAVTTLPRITEMGIPPYLVASTVNLVIAQRLARKICPHCKKKFAARQKEIDLIEKQLGVDLKKLMEAEGISGKQIFLYRGEGCKMCRQEGLHGRIGLYEVLQNTPEIYSAIIGGSSMKEINKAAHDQGMLSLAEDGVVKVLLGETTLEELLRVI
jgi:type IV pilus assembly protein PilB